MADDLIETMARAMWHRPVTYARVPFDALDVEDQDVFRAYARATFAAIEAAGYRVVPVEPTEAMVQAGGHCGAWAVGRTPREQAGMANPKTCYVRMLAAAPRHGGPR